MSFNIPPFLAVLTVAKILVAILTISGENITINLSSNRYLSYEPEMDQIEALISVSEYCEQEVINNCTSNSLTGFAWWLDRNGGKYQYWHGDRNETAVGKGLKLFGSLMRSSV